MSEVSGSARSRRMASHPSIRGMARSMTITAGHSACAAATASSPLSAVTTRNPANRRYSPYISRASAESSTRSTRALMLSTSCATLSGALTMRGLWPTVGQRREREKSVKYPANTYVTNAAHPQICEWTCKNVVTSAVLLEGNLVPACPFPCNGLHDVAQDLLRVPERHEGLLVVIELVLDAGKARIHGSLDRDHGLRLVGIDDRHTKNRAALVVARRGVDDVVGADDETDVGLRHIGIDVVHLDERLVRDLGLGEEHVHVPGHAPCHRMDRELDVDALPGQLFVQL